MSLGQDVLDLIACRLLLDTLQARPIESLRAFLAFSCTSHWKASLCVYRTALHHFTLDGDVEALVKQTSSCEERASLVRLYTLLRSLDQFANPLRELPSTVEDWKHAYTFLLALRRFTNCSERPELPAWTTVHDGYRLCAHVLRDNDGQILRSCIHAKRELHRLANNQDDPSVANFETALSELVEQHPFLISRSGCTLIGHWPAMWVDEPRDHQHHATERRSNKFLRHWLGHDNLFLSAVDTHGIPSAHSLFTLGVCSMATTALVTSHPSFQLEQRSLLDDDTVFHALSRFHSHDENLIVTSHPDRYAHNKLLMGREMTRKYEQTTLLTHKNKQGFAPWEVCAHTTHFLLATTMMNTESVETRYKLRSAIKSTCELTQLLCRE